MTSDAQLRAAAQKLSRRLRAGKRTPAEEAADWMDYALAAGGQPFLYPAETGMTWVQLHSIDVLAAGAALCTALSLLVAVSVHRCLRSKMEQAHVARQREARQRRVG